MVQQVNRITHLSCPTCKKEIATINMFNGYMELHDIIVVCATCKDTLHEIDMIISSDANFKQNEKFLHENPYQNEGC